MKLEFYKYQGTGNDFILIDDRQNKLNLSTANVRSLCDRRFGIGADGVILLRMKSGYDFDMVYFNSDGNLSSMCGNGGRCITSFARLLGIIQQKAKFYAADGDHESEFVETNLDVVKLKMKDVKLIETHDKGWFLDTGSPHLVLQLENVDSVDVKNAGSEIRYSQQYKAVGVNVNFAKFSEQGVRMRTYERGVEDETLSCGTGVTATVLAGLKNGLIAPHSRSTVVETMGGKLLVYATKVGEGYVDVWLEGPAEFVFKGEVNI